LTLHQSAKRSKAAKNPRLNGFNLAESTRQPGSRARHKKRCASRPGSSRVLHARDANRVRFENPHQSEGFSNLPGPTDLRGHVRLCPGLQARSPLFGRVLFSTLARTSPGRVAEKSARQLRARRVDFLLSLTAVQRFCLYRVAISLSRWLLRTRRQRKIGAR
jgi:hypothetical protein